MACGNYVPPDESLSDLYATGLDATTLRTMLAHTATRVREGTWSMGVTDIRQAFVLAPWVGGAVAIQPPNIAVRLGLSDPGDYWLVKKSLYGLREAPAIWSHFRDTALREMTWTTRVDGENALCYLEQLKSDEQVWKMKRKGSDQILGYVLVYVDDVLMIGIPEVMNDFYQLLSERWECDNLTKLTREEPIRFLGMELHLGERGFELAQYGFVNELLRSHGHNGRRSTSQENRDAWLLSTEEEEALTSAAGLQQVPESPELRLAQRRVGELLWLTSRTRPDLQYATSILASRVSKIPELVNELGTRLLDYLEETKHYRLTFDGSRRDEVLEVYTDSSFSPSSSRSHGSIGVFYLNAPLVWRSARQSMVTLSTAESELVESIEGALMGYSVQDLLYELTGVSPKLEIHIDNQAALALLCGSTGSWRTRHLRLRSSWVKERITNGEIVVVYEPGESQRVDIGTKPLARDRLLQLVGQWGMKNAAHECSVRVSRFSSSSPTPSTTVSTASTNWLGKLSVLCSWCSTQVDGAPDSEAPPDSSSTAIQVGFPWEFYTVMVVFVIAVIGLWELTRRTWTSRSTRLQSLRTQATTSLETEPLTREEMGEFQALLNVEPGDLSLHQAERLLELRLRFNSGGPQRLRSTRRRSAPTAMASGSAPMSSLSPSASGLASSMPSWALTPGSELTLSSSASASGAASSRPPSALASGSTPMMPSLVGNMGSTSAISFSASAGGEPSMQPTSSSAQHQSVGVTHVAIQTDPPAFEYMPPTPTTILRMVPHDGPYHYVPGRPVMHLYRNCWGLRNAGTVNQINVCRCCAENNGQRMFPE